MIPQKQKATNLDEQLDKDIKAAEDKSKEDIKKSKPKLAQAAVMKYSKYATIAMFACIVGYKMFFSGTSTDKKVVKKKQVSKNISKSEEEQKKLQKSSAGNVSSKPSDLTEENKNQIKAISSKMYSNTETLSSVSVPKLTIPETPNVPEIKTITIEKEVTSKEKQLELTKQLEEQKKEIEELKALQKKQLQENNKNEKNNSNGNSGNLPSNNANNTLNSPISKSTQNNSSIRNLNNRYNGSRNNNPNATDSSVIEKMFLLSGSTTQSTSSTTSSSSKDDFIIVDTSTISEKQPISSDNDNSTQQLTNLEYTIATGRVIEGVLETAINSESAGVVRAVVSRDVYGESGNYILIPRGSRLYGSYIVTQSATQRRLLITWNKILRPDGLIVSISAETYDQTGRKGIEGEIDTRYGEMFRNSLLYSFIALGTAVAIEKLAGIKGTSITANGALSSTTISPAATAAQSVIESVQDITDKMTDGMTDDLNSIITIPQGFLFYMMPTTDIIIKRPYKRRTQNVHLD